MARGGLLNTIYLKNISKKNRKSFSQFFFEVLLSQYPVEITRERTVHLFISKIDLDYSSGQMKLSEETRRQCKFALTGGNSVGIEDSKREFTCLPIN